MKNSWLTKFNTFCLTLSLFFGLGIFWQWHGAFASTIVAENLPTPVARQEVIPEASDQQPAIQTSSNGMASATPIQISTVPTVSPIALSHITSSPSPSPTLPSIPDADNADDLPPRINLAVPFTSQAPEKNWDQPWQDACEEAALLMMDAYYKDYGLSILFAKAELLKMVAWEEERGWGLSIEIEKIKEMADVYSDLGKSGTLRIVENPTVEDLKKFIANKQPVYVVADGKVLPNPHFRNGGPEYHALVIRGYTEDSFITNDPGTQFGENFVYKYDDLMKSIRDWNEGDVKSGRRVVMVVE